MINVKRILIKYRDGKRATIHNIEHTHLNLFSTFNYLFGGSVAFAALLGTASCSLLLVVY